MNTDNLRYAAAGFFGVLLMGLLVLNASKTNFGAVNNKIEVPRHDTFAESQNKLDDAHVPYIFSLNALKYIATGK